MVGRMVELTFSFSNMHGVVNDNSNPYKKMIMDSMKINQDYASEYSIIDEKPNAYMTRFFFF